MPQDAFHIKRLASELNETLLGGKVNRISQADKDEVTFIIYTKKGTLKLVFNTNASFARITVQNTEKPPLLTAPSFCMLLRKHLLGGEILSVEQRGNERIVAVTFLCFNDFSGGKKVLYAELMGKYSNLILVENGVILGALKCTPPQNTSGRVLFSGAKYVLPQKQDKAPPDDETEIQEKWNAFLESVDESENAYSETTAKYLFSTVAGIALPTARHIVNEAITRNIDEEKFPAFFADFYQNEPTVPYVLEENGAYTDFFAFPTQNGEEKNSLNDAEAEYFLSRAENREFNEKKTRLLAAVGGKIKKCEKNLSDINDRLSAADGAETHKIKGELLTANLYRIRKGDAFFVAQNWYNENEEVKISLDETLSPSANAQKYFKAYAKAKRTKEALLPRKQEEENQLDYLYSVRSFIQRAENKDDLTETEEELREIGVLPAERNKKKKTQPSVPFRTYEINGFTILTGRNNVSNDRLVKSLSAEDIWLHAQKYHSAHVGILAEGKDVPDEVLLKAAEICAKYSEAKNGEKIAVDYAKRKYVKKPSKAAAGFVTYSMQKTLYVFPLQNENDVRKNG